MNNEEDENNSAVTVEVSEEVTDTQATVIAAPESSPTTTVQHSTPSLDQLAITAAQSSLTNQRVLQTGIRHGASCKKQRMDTSQNESRMGDILEIMKMDMIVGSPQVPFLMCTLEIPQKLQHKFFTLNFCYLYF